MAINARYIAENPGEQGMCKVVLDADTNRSTRSAYGRGSLLRNDLWCRGYVGD